MRKKAFVICLTICLILSSAVFAEDKKEILGQKPCPKTTMITDCLKCHVPGTFKVIQPVSPYSHFELPTAMMELRHDSKKVYGIYRLREVNAEDVDKFLYFLRSRNIKHAVIEIFSPGGGLFAAQKIVAHMEEFQSWGGTVETRIYGAALSAGFYIFVGGTKGYRFVHPDAELMWHELLSLEGVGFVFTTPSDSEERSKILRHFQDVRNKYLASRSNITKEKLDEMVRKREWWMTGRDAVKYGFADGYIESATYTKETK